MNATWHYDATDCVWRLSVNGRDLYAVASNRQPTRRETFRIIRRLRRFYPWLRADEFARPAPEHACAMAATHGWEQGA